MQKKPRSLVVTASLLIIGDEILSGRTQDKNAACLGKFLAPIGIEMAEIRILRDRHAEIIAAVNRLRKKYDYLFTTGGIGPTHDDITAEAVAQAFGVEIAHDPRAVDILQQYYQPEQRTKARMRMARMPVGCHLIENPVSAAPGFQMENVFVLAGVPNIMQAMLESLRPRLDGGAPILSVTFRTNGMEGDVSQKLAEIQSAHPDILIGSYPFFANGAYGTRLVLRARDQAKLTRAMAVMEKMLREENYQFALE